LRVGIETRAHLESTRKRALRLEKPDQVGGRLRQIDIWNILGKIGFECILADAEGFLKAVGRKPSGEGSSVVFHARTLRKPLDI
jgi:hypothetical protein